MLDGMFKWAFLIFFFFNIIHNQICMFEILLKVLKNGGYFEARTNAFVSFNGAAATSGETAIQLWYFRLQYIFGSFTLFYTSVQILQMFTARVEECEKGSQKKK